MVSTGRRPELILHYPMSKKAKIQFWVVNLWDPQTDCYYEEVTGIDTHYVRTLEEAKAMIEKHTKEYMPNKPDAEIEALRKAYGEWTPYDPQTGEKNEPLPQPPQFETLPLWTWEEYEKKDGSVGWKTVVNELAKRMDSDEFSTGWNDQTWEGDNPFGATHQVTLD